jgi:hypothetical protein
MKRVMTFVTGLVLLVAMAAFAQESSQKTTTSTKEHKAKTEVTRQASGTISSSQADKLVIDHKVKGKEEPITFVMNDKTQKEGDLKSGEKVTVHYMVEGGQNVATMVKVNSQTASSSGGKSHKH